MLPGAVPAGAATRRRPSHAASASASQASGRHLHDRLQHPLHLVLVHQVLLAGRIRT